MIHNLNDIDLSRHIFTTCMARTISSGSGRTWNRFNAVCCRHNGETIDTKKRAGFLITYQSGIIYNCFNCGFKSGWTPGRSLSLKFSKLLFWFGLSHIEIMEINFAANKIRDSGPREYQTVVEQTFNFVEKPLPPGAKSFLYWLEETPLNPQFIDVFNYLCERGDDVIPSYDFHWSPQKRNRVIIPFKWKEKIVGWTARATILTKTRYVTESQPNYLFNTECITKEQKYLILCEGPFDALAIGGVATLGNHISTEQCKWLNNTGKTIIVLPDREKAGGILVDVALREKWYVSFPKWGVGVKDASYAVKLLGKLYSLWSVISNKDNRPAAIAVYRKMLLR